MREPHDLKKGQTLRLTRDFFSFMEILELIERPDGTIDDADIVKLLTITMFRNELQIVYHGTADTGYHLVSVREGDEYIDHFFIDDEDIKSVSYFVDEMDFVVYDLQVKLKRAELFRKIGNRKKALGL